MGSLSIFTRIYLGLVCFSLAGYALTRVLRIDAGPVAPISSFVTLLVGAVAVCAPFASRWRQIVAVYVFGSLVELVGTSTGLPFGPYKYTDRWQPVIYVPLVGYFPLAVSIAWTLITFACATTVVHLKKGTLDVSVYAVLAGLLAAFIDLGMEPVMTQVLGYWHWSPTGPLPGGASWLNPVGWFLTTSLAAYFLLRGNKLPFGTPSSGTPRFASGQASHPAATGQAFHLAAACALDPLYVLGGHVVLTLGIGLIGMSFPVSP